MTVGLRDNRTHYLHIEVFNGKLWENHILFRDYLKKHPDVMEEYRKLKRELSKEFGNDRRSYTSGKSDFIIRIITRAKESMTR